MVHTVHRLSLSRTLNPKTVCTNKGTHLIRDEKHQPKYFIRIKTGFYCPLEVKIKIVQND